MASEGLEEDLASPPAGSGFSSCGGWVAPGRPLPDLASPRPRPLAAHPAPGACPASRAPDVPDGPIGHGAEQQVAAEALAAAAAAEVCGGREGEVGRGGGNRGERRVRWFFLLAERKGERCGA